MRKFKISNWFEGEDYDDEEVETSEVVLDPEEDQDDDVEVQTEGPIGPINLGKYYEIRVLDSDGNLSIKRIYIK